MAVSIVDFYSLSRALKIRSTHAIKNWLSVDSFCFLKIWLYLLSFLANWWCQFSISSDHYGIRFLMDYAYSVWDKDLWKCWFFFFYLFFYCGSNLDGDDAWYKGLSLSLLRNCRSPWLLVQLAWCCSSRFIDVPWIILEVNTSYNHVCQTWFSGSLLKVKGFICHWAVQSLLIAKKSTFSTKCHNKWAIFHALNGFYYKKITYIMQFYSDWYVFALLLKLKVGYLWPQKKSVMSAWKSFFCAAEDMCVYNI